MKKKQGKFFTDSEGRVRYIGNDRKAKDTGGAQVAKTETAPQRREKGQFITKDNRVIFVGGPGGGGGTSEGSGASQSQEITTTLAEAQRDIENSAITMKDYVKSGEWDVVEEIGTTASYASRFLQNPTEENRQLYNAVKVAYMHGDLPSTRTLLDRNFSDNVDIQRILNR